jgi:hypothetical protein
VLTSIIILSLSLVQDISGKSSEVFIDHLTNLIWEDCRGKDIHINQPVIIDLETNKSIPLIKWAYNKSKIKDIIRIFGEEQPYFSNILSGTCEDKGPYVGGIDGCGILTCGNNWLDINGYNYFWNGIKVDVPKEEFKVTSGNNSPIIETGDSSPVTTGDKSPITTGDNSPINQKELNIAFAQGTIFGTIFGIMLKFLYDYISARYFKKHI